MNYRAAVKAFFDGGGQLQLGVGVSLAVGPVGRSADISASAPNTSHIAATYAYSASKGLYLGYSLEGSKISERVNTNAAFYGRRVSAHDVLTGIVYPPQEAARLYDILNLLGAGPRPGLPFASQNSKRTQSMQSTIRPTPVAPINYSNRPPPTTSGGFEVPPPTTSDGFEEPPPPYQANDGPHPPISHQSSNTSNYQPQPNSISHQSSFQSQTNDASPAKEKDLFNQAYMSHPTYQPSSSYQAAYEPPSPMAGDKGKGANRYMPPVEQSSSSSLSSAPPISPIQPHTDIKTPLHQEEMTVVVAKYDYHSDSPSDLQFSAGDHIIVIKRLEDRQSWWEGEIGTRRGFFPANYTEDLE